MDVKRIFWILLISTLDYEVRGHIVALFFSQTGLSALHRLKNLNRNDEKR